MNIKKTVLTACACVTSLTLMPNAFAEGRVSTHNQTGSTIEIFHNGAAIPLLKPIAQDQYGKPLPWSTLNIVKTFEFKNGENLSHDIGSATIDRNGSTYTVHLTLSDDNMAYNEATGEPLTDGETFNKDDNLVISLQGK